MSSVPVGELRRDEAEESGSESEEESGSDSDSEQWQPPPKGKKRNRRRRLAAQGQELQRTQKSALRNVHLVGLRRKQRDAGETDESSDDVDGVHRQKGGKRRRQKKQRRSVPQEDDEALRDAERAASRKNKQLTLSAFKIEFRKHLADPKTRHHKIKQQADYDDLVKVVSVLRKFDSLLRKYVYLCAILHDLRTIIVLNAQCLVCATSCVFAQKDNNFTQTTCFAHIPMFLRRTCCLRKITTICAQA
jgi:hypothetical protein